MTDSGYEDKDSLKGQSQTLTRPKDKVSEPSLFRVLILNDDFTPMDFVVHVLKRFFSKDEAQATQTMLNVHRKGAGIAGVYTFEIAETKMAQVNEYSRKHEYPLRCTMEKV